MSKSVVINSNDIPSAKHLIDSISRLRKDYSLLSKFRGKNDIEDPESFKAVIGFLEILLKREKRNLAGAMPEGFMEVSIQVVAKHLSEMDDWELRQTIEETDLKSVFERLNRG